MTSGLPTGENEGEDKDSYSDTPGKEEGNIVTL
jgi:hypothetical protein